MSTGYFSTCGKKEVRPVQLSATKHILKYKTTIMTDDCGFGKTIVILHAAVGVANSQCKTLIVSDAEAAKGTWATEHTKWEHLKHLRVVTLAGTTPAKRLKLLAQDADVYVINYHMLGWLAKNNTHQFAMVAADEADCLKGSKSVWRDHLLALSEHSQIRVAATATPAAQSPIDYWGILRWADDGELLGQDVGVFRAMYCYKTDYKGWKLRNKKAGDDIRNKIKHLFIEHEQAPETIIPIETHYVECELKPESRRLYDEFLEVGEQALGLQSIEKNDKPLSKLQISNKLSCLTSGFIYSDIVEQIGHYDLMMTDDIDRLMKDTTKRVAIPIFNDRQELFMKTLAEVERIHGKGRIIIVYWYKHELAQLQEMLPTGVSDADCSDERWNSGQDDYLFAQYLRSAKGRNWQENCNVMIAYSQAFHFIQTYQMIRRIARQGQSADKVYLYLLHFVNTIDDRKREVIAERLESHMTMRKLIIDQTQRRELAQ